MAIAGVFGDLIGVRGVFLGGAVIVALAAVASFLLFRGAGHPAAAPSAVADKAVAA
jgi:hypothetical protein